MAHILLAVTGSIASYKSVDLVSSLKKQGHQVTVLMTQAATEFYPTFDTTGLITESCPLGCHEGTLS